jgi:hypothetical protein
MAYPRVGFIAVLLLTDKVLVADGTNAELFDSLTGHWSGTGSKVTASASTGTLLPSGEVLVTGGAGAELYHQ